MFKFNRGEESVVGKVTFLQAVMELPSPPLPLPLALPSRGADTLYIRGDSKLLLWPKHKGEHTSESSPYSVQKKHDVVNPTPPSQTARNTANPADPDISAGFTPLIGGATVSTSLGNGKPQSSDFPPCLCGHSASA